MTGTSRGEGGTPAGVIVLVDDDSMLCELHERWLGEEGYDVRVYNDGEASLAGLTEVIPDAVLLDLVMPGITGFETLERIKQHHPGLPVIVMTAQADAASAVEAMKLGAYDYLVKPVDRPKLVTEVRNTVERSRLTVRLTELEREVEGTGYPGIVGQSKLMKQLFRRLDRIAPSDITVLIQGESGSGKELVAKAIHEQSGRADKRLVALSCAAIPESLQESELFGHEKGAFTGATSRRTGCFERAHGGTLFLDEIGELSPGLQAKLLRVLQERAFQRVGGSTTIRSDFRLIAATNRDLASDVREGKMREDLYFRVAVMEVQVPPLRDRVEDIPLLAEHFLTVFSRDRRKKLEIAPATMELLMAYGWPGNVRELQNAIERGIVESNGRVILPRDLPPRIRTGAAAVPPGNGDGKAEAEEGTPPGAVETAGAGGVRSLEEIERDAIRAALARNRGNMSQVVRELGIGRTTLYRKLKKYNLR